MTEQQLRQNVANIINAWVGATKGSAAHKEILTTYNTFDHASDTVKYAVQPWDDYCDTTVSAAYIKAGVAKWSGTECGVERHTKIAKKLGCWVEADNHVPALADSCVYDWQDNGQGDCTGWADHIGIVTAVASDKKSFTVTEGNMSGGVVGKRTIQVNARYIRGFIAPDFAAAAKALSGTGSTTAKPAPTSYRDAVQKRFGFDDNTMAFLDKHPWKDSLYQKLATKG